MRGEMRLWEIWSKDGYLKDQIFADMIQWRAEDRSKVKFMKYEGVELVELEEVRLAQGDEIVKVITAEEERLMDGFDTFGN